MHRVLVADALSETGLRVLRERPEICYVILLDGDGQHVPEEIPDFLAAANDSRAPLVIGNRMSDLRAMPFVRKCTNRYMSWQISQLCGQRIPDTQCGYRMLRADLLPALVDARSNNYDFETEMLFLASRAGHRIAPVSVATVYGDEKSKINPLRDTVRFFQLLRRLSR
jgi:hypothetical protein